MLLVVMLFGMATALFVYGMVDTNALVLRRNKDTAAAFADVKLALVGWSAARTPTGPSPNARPGELPCPDIDNTGNDPGGCSVGAIGRVPWKSLGIPEPKDSAGETLWYAIAGPFRYYHPTNNPDPIHSDTKGNITVYQDSTASAITTEAVAVLFAPGASLGTQNRDTSTALCPTTGTTIARNLCAANYLETAATVNNSITNGPFILAQSSDTFNDKVMAITTSDLMPIVEQRVAREMRTILENYRIATAAQGYNGGAGIYPWADCTDGTSDTDYPNRGRIPWQNAAPVNWGSGTPATPSLPNWFTNQGSTSYNWAWVIYYSVGKNYLENFGASCSIDVRWGCEPGQTSLSVNGVWGTRVVIFMPGPAGGSRPGVPYVGDVVGGWGTANWGLGICNADYWQSYLDDPINNDVDDDRYITPTSTAYARDRLYTIP
jgi:hypothetical protein